MARTTSGSDHGQPRSPRSLRRGRPPPRTRAVKVADRFHWVLNLSQAVERELAVNRRQLRIASPSAPGLPPSPTTEEVKSQSKPIQERLARARLDAHGKTGDPVDIGNAVALFCSEQAGWITGQLIAVDGGARWMDAALPLEIQHAVPQATPIQ